MAFARNTLSASSGGEGILVVGTTSGAATPIHSVPGGQQDEVWVWAFNVHSAEVVLTIEWGNNAVKDRCPIPLPPQDGMYVCIEGLTLAAGKAVTAFASVTNVVTIVGHTNEITP